MNVDIADGLSDLGSKTPSSSREPFKRNLVCEKEDYYLYHYQSVNEKSMLKQNTSKQF